MRFLASVLSALLVSFTDAALVFNREHSPVGWTRGARADADAQVSFMIAVKQRNLEQLEKTFWAVSTPGSSQYRKFLKHDEINAMVAPEQSTLTKIVDFLGTHGVQQSEITSYGDAIRVKTSAMVAESLFNTDLFEYTRDEDNVKVIKQFGEMHLPDEVHCHVDFVTGLTGFPMESRLGKKNFVSGAKVGGTMAVIPQTIFSLYDVSQGTPSSNVTQGVIEFQGQYFSPKDVAIFSNKTNVPIQPVPTSQIIGTNVPSESGVESTLDIEMIAAVNQEASNWFWIEDPANWVYEFGVHFANTADVPDVISISYAWWENGQCSIDQTYCLQNGVNSQTYVNRTNVELQKIGARGVAVFVASGDSGANGRTDLDCVAPQLRADFPSSSPYVTSVGATQIDTPKYALTNPPAICTRTYLCPSGGSEVAVSYAQAEFASGGGFSAFQPQPSYQTAAVAGYLGSGVALPPATYFNKSGRAYPDVAALGSAILTYEADQGGLQLVGGTSAASPLWAGIWSLLSQVAVETDGAPLGFANPLLYQMGAAYAPGSAASPFNDITVGNNKCTEDGCSPSCQGFTATTGWDAVSGWGSPNFPNLVSYIKKNVL